MKRIIKASTLVVLFATCISWMNCGDDNPLAPSSLAGTWNLVIFTDKEDNITVNAGEATDLGQGVIMIVTMGLVLTETRYTFASSITVSVPGFPPETETITSTGTYSISGSTLTTVEDGTGDTDTSTISTSGDQLTIEDDEVKLVFQKQ